MAITIDRSINTAIVRDSDGNDRFAALDFGGTRECVLLKREDQGGGWTVRACTTLLECRQIVVNELRLAGIGSIVVNRNVPAAVVRQDGLDRWSAIQVGADGEHECVLLKRYDEGGGWRVMACTTLTEAKQLVAAELEISAN